MARTVLHCTAKASAFPGHGVAPLGLRAPGFPSGSKGKVRGTMQGQPEANSLKAY